MTTFFSNYGLKLFKITQNYSNKAILHLHFAFFLHFDKLDDADFKYGNSFF